MPEDTPIRVSEEDAAYIIERQRSEIQHLKTALQAEVNEMVAELHNAWAYRWKKHAFLDFSGAKRLLAEITTERDDA